MSVKSEGKLFYAEIPKGYTFKVTIDSLVTIMNRGTFIANKDGIFFRQADEAEHILYDANFPRKNLPGYACKKEIFFNLNLSHFHKLMKNVKKKDSIVMYIDMNEQEKLSLVIKPSDSKTNPSDSRTENIFVVIKQLQIQPPIMDLPDIMPDGAQVYTYPKVIKSSEVQKMKKMTSVGKIIKVEMQGSNYISFEADRGELYGSRFEYGQKLDEQDIKHRDDIDKSELFLYNAQFNVSSFVLLTKLPGLCSQMQFYAPTVPHYPIKIGMDALGLGTINVYVKDIDQINCEQKQKEHEITTVSATNNPILSY